jgi:hypothetical protein|tara:strand:- start:149 stop:532 length:384 start_codon:yes stop_codon:yes gene_type:complete
MEDGDIIELDPSLDNYSQQEAEDISESFSISTIFGGGLDCGATYEEYIEYQNSLGISYIVAPNYEQMFINYTTICNGNEIEYVPPVSVFEEMLLKYGYVPTQSGTDKTFKSIVVIGASYLILKGFFK